MLELLSLFSFLVVGLVLKIELMKEYVELSGENHMGG